jgi:integrase
MVKITKRAVDALVCNDSNPAYLWDDVLAGFGVKALLSGVKRYIVKYRLDGGGRGAPQRWLTLGAHGQITADQARGLAQKALAAVAQGEDPQADKFQRRSAPTLLDAWLRFEAEQLPLKKRQTRDEYKSQWRGLIESRFGKVKVENISRGDIDRFHKSMCNAPYRANRVLALLSRLMSLTEAWEWRAQGTNPCKNIERFAEKARTRFLNAEELSRLGQAMRDLIDEGALLLTAANAVELLLLTGARLNEMLTAEWAWVDWNRAVINLPDSKTGAKPVYLSDASVALLQRQKKVSASSEFIFPSVSHDGHFVNLRKSWCRICERAGLESVRLHDLRHTAASIAIGQGASLPIVGKLLGHSQAQTTLRYAHVDIDPALRVANSVGSAVGLALGNKAVS